MRLPLRHYAEKKMLFYTRRRGEDMKDGENLPAEDSVKDEDITGYFKHPTLKTVLVMLHEDYPNLTHFILETSKAIKQLLNCSQTCVENCAVMFLHYPPGAGFNLHIDGVSSFGDKFGPIFNVNMNDRDQHFKIFDLFPTLNSRDMMPMRSKTKLFETTMIQGDTRALWSHCVPVIRTFHQYTIAFKFGDVDTGLPIINKYSEVLDADIPEIQILLGPGATPRQQAAQTRKLIDTHETHEVIRRYEELIDPARKVRPFDGSMHLVLPIRSVQPRPTPAFDTRRVDKLQEAQSSSARAMTVSELQPGATKATRGGLSKRAGRLGNL